MTPSKNPLASTPPMGWNSWNMFGHNISEASIRETADALVSSGLKDLGYGYIVIDDCWSRKDGRDGNDDLVANPEKFPNGIKALADYVHTLGFKIGIYSDAAEKTCGGYPGSYAKGKVITGLDAAASLPDTKVFHAGTSRSGQDITTSGGRVLGVTAWGNGIRGARAAAYAAVNAIQFEGAQFRRDIAAKALLHGAASV